MKNQVNGLSVLVSQTYINKTLSSPNMLRQNSKAQKARVKLLENKVLRYE